ncbi:MAG TPA: 5'/3'-nucleotidase SurE [Acidimicrobiales bacterium]|nr:5'/3'-nucleotidase SurE [Acidimicrobiales bacterium]
MRILVTNDDGVHAPGLGALVRALARWAKEGGGHEILVVAPLANYSGASAAVGTVYEREAVGFRRIHIEGAEAIEAYGLDAPPALTVVVGAFGAFGPTPDLVVSGINLGVNVGRSILHSGTVGAALTAAQHGLRSLAVSLRSQPVPHHWETAAEIALRVIPAVAAAPPRTVLNLNVPALPLDQLRGVVSGRISDAGIVKGAHAEMTGGDAGSVGLVLGTAIPSLGDTSGEDPSDDAALVAAGYASLTALRGVAEDHRPEIQAVVERAVREASRLLSP